MAQNPGFLNKIKLTESTFTGWVPRYIVPGMWCNDYQAAPDPSLYFDDNTKIVGVDYDNYEITIFPATLAAIPAGYDFKLQQDPDDIDPIVYADTPEGTEVRQFYIDSNFTEKWEPPIANKFYTFKRKDGGYNIGDSGVSSEMRKITNSPLFKATFNSTGKVVGSTGFWTSSSIYSTTNFFPNNFNPIPVVMTGWRNYDTVSSLQNFYHNVKQEVQFT
jgi:hypothetical protein